MKPNFTSNILRELNKCLSGSASVDHSAKVTSDWKAPGLSIKERSTAYLFYNLTRKMVRATDIEGRGPCLEKFLLTEKNNETANLKILDGKGLTNDLILRIIRARGIIQQIIGDSPTTSVLENATFTGGASTSRKRKESFVELKVIPTWESLNCTNNAYPFFKLWTDNCLLAYSEAIEIGAIRDVRISEHARWSSVPKESEMDRAIVVGNDVNVALQRGVGIVLRNSLLRYGIDLRDQSRNRELARMASIDDTLVTHDAVDSSNRIVFECVKMLLPRKWFQYLDAISERTCTLPSGEVHRLHLFSSMGNGFTFELQSLLYFALAVASGSKPIAAAVNAGLGVYGDDVIIESEAYGNFLSLIAFFGMEANLEKSYSAGIFRESCGGHYMFGSDITPFFLRAEFGHDPSVHYKFCNELVSWCERNGHPVPWSVINRVITRLPTHQRNQVPTHVGIDKGFHFDHPDIRPIKYKNSRTKGTLCTYFSYEETRTSLTLRSECELPWYLLTLWSGSGLDGRRDLIVTGTRRVKRITQNVGLVHEQRFKDAYGRPWIVGGF